MPSEVDTPLFQRPFLNLEEAVALVGLKPPPLRRAIRQGQVERDGFTRQRTAIESYAATRSIQIERWFEEKGVSGTKDLTDRPQLSALMVALLSDGVDLVLVERRVTRWCRKESSKAC